MGKYEDGSCPVLGGASLGCCLCGAGVIAVAAGLSSAYGECCDGEGGMLFMSPWIDEARWFWDEEIISFVFAGWIRLSRRVWWALVEVSRRILS